MKLADDYSLREHWQEEVEKHIKILHCTYEEALEILAWDIKCETDNKFEPLTEGTNWILQMIGVIANKERELENV